MKIVGRVCLFITVAFVVCGGDLLFAGGKKASGKIEVVFSGMESATTGQSRMMQEVVDLLNASGRFNADIQVSGALSNNNYDLVTQAKTGIPIVVSTEPGRLASQFHIADLNILMTPYVLTDPAVLDRLPDTALFKEWQAELEKQGIVLLANMFNGYRSFYTTVPVTKVADLHNLRIRGFDDDVGSALAKYLGFVNIGIAGWDEVFFSIQQNMLDGCEVQAAAAYGAGIYEVAKYLALTKHYMLQTSFICSTELLDSMPQADRDFFLKTIRDTAEKYGDIIAEEEAGYYQRMENNGVTVTEVNIQEFRDAIAPLYTNNDLGFSEGLEDRLFRELGL